MANRGGQPGNSNAAKGADWRDAIRYVLAERGSDEPGDEAAYKKGLRRAARMFMDAVEAGGLAEFRELGDRIDGKAAQAVTLTGDADNPLEMKWTVEIVDKD